MRGIILSRGRWRLPDARPLQVGERAWSPGQEEDPSIMLDWIGRKEEEWETLAQEDFRPMDIQGALYDPFDTKGINDILESGNLFYGAGDSGQPETLLLPSPCLMSRDGLTVLPSIPAARNWPGISWSSPALSQENHARIEKGCGKALSVESNFLHQEIGEAGPRLRIRNLWREGWRFRRIETEFPPHRFGRGMVCLILHHEIGEIRGTVFDRRGMERPDRNLSAHTD